MCLIIPDSKSEILEHRDCVCHVEILYFICFYKASVYFNENSNPEMISASRKWDYSVTITNDKGNRCASYLTFNRTAYSNHYVYTVIFT